MNISIVCPGTLFPSVVGVLKALEVHGIRIDALTTTSLATIPCALYCAGHTVDKIRYTVNAMSPLPIKRTFWSYFNKYYTPHLDLCIDPVINVLPDHCGHLHIPLNVLTLNNDTGYLAKHASDTEHHLPTVVKAAASLSPIMRPVVHSGARHSDASCVPLDYRDQFSSFVILVRSKSNDSEQKFIQRVHRDLYMHTAVTFQHSESLADVVIDIERYPIDTQQTVSQSERMINDAYNQAYIKIRSLKRKRKLP